MIETNIPPIYIFILIRFFGTVGGFDSFGVTLRTWLEKVAFLKEYSTSIICSLLSSANRHCSSDSCANIGLMKCGEKALAMNVMKVSLLSAASLGATTIRS